MRIVIVMGIPGAGKSTYIRENFQNATIIDLKDFQNYISFNTTNVFQSYEDCKNELIKAINRNDEIIVMEHTLLKAIRRELYINAIKEVTDTPIEIVLINPSKEKLIENWKKRKMYTSDESIDMHLELLEVPTLEEGFSNVTIVS